VNQEYAAADTPLKDGDEVGLLPPVSGGSQSTKLAAIVRGKIDTQEVLSNMKNRSDGAVVIFEGIVRGHTRGRSTLYLEYEAYEEMALKQMESLRAQARADFKIREARIVHRLGRLEIGETSVLTVVASEHRAAAFDACRWLIDTLKKTVPIWKKEYFEEGAVWADGEPFPDEITPGKGTK
jgi:molybdopterin synthase catalytic subunit